MSNYSHALTRIIDLRFEGKQVRLAEKCSVPQALISKHCSGNYRPEPDTLAKICSSLEPQDRAELAVAHLLDETPEDARPFVSVESGTRPLVLQDRYDPISALDKRTRSAIEFIAQKAVSSRDARDALQSTARVLGCDI